MPELLDAPSEEEISSHEQQLGEQKQEVPTADELERIAAAAGGKSAKLQRYREALDEARDEVNDVKDPVALRTLLNEALSSYLASIEEMQAATDRIAVDVQEKRQELQRLQKLAAGSSEESMHNLRKAGFASKIEHAQQRLQSSASQLTSYELQRTQAHNHLAALIFETSERGGVFRLIDSVNELLPIMKERGYGKAADGLSEAIEAGAIEGTDALSEAREKLLHRDQYRALASEVDAAAVDYTRDQLSNELHASKLGEGELHAVRTKAGQLISAAVSFYGKKLRGDSQRAA